MPDFFNRDSNSSLFTTAQSFPDGLQFYDSLAVFGTSHRLFGGDQRIQVQYPALDALKVHNDGMSLHFGMISHTGDF
jgi:hypothetical protein